MSPTGTLHLVFSLLAIVFGAVVLMLPKGTRWHRTWGHGYAWCMLGVVATSFALYNLTGRLTPFHAAAAIAGVTLVAGLRSVLVRRPKKHWIDVHARFMAWSYVGLLAALVAESLTRYVMPPVETTLDRGALWPAFWTLVGVGTFGVVGAGGWLIRRRLPDSVRGVPAAMRGEREELARQGRA